MNSIFILIRILVLVILVFHRILFAQNDSTIHTKNEWEVFPILNYDTDVGYGYGAKGFFYNFLKKGESFDITSYNSTKGERWYRFVFSIPDMQRRQGKKYDTAFDLIIDYDKWINYTYYFDSQGSFSESMMNEKENYIREPIEISAMLSRAFTREIIVELGLGYKSISCYEFDLNGKLQTLKPSTVQHLSFLLNLKLDTRTNFINPNKGYLIQLSNEIAKDILGQKQNFIKMGLRFQSYLKVLSSKLVLASRVILQTVTDVTYQNLLPLGGNSSVRGLPQDRYLSQSFALINEEIRFPIWERISGIIGVDIGNSKSTPKWIFNPVVGLRFNMDNFIVRADLGFGKESTGFYFNFGHLF
jgi:outer membrane protein assembly factor BamA